MSEPKHKSVSQIATALGVSGAAVDRVIQGKGIKAATWFGTCRVFDPAAVRQIEAELKAIAQRRAARRRQPAAEAATAG